MSNQDFTWFRGEVDHHVVREIAALKAKERDERLVGTGDDLMMRFLRGFHPAKRKFAGRPLWARVSEALGHGSQVSQVICRKYGFDPDMLVKQRRI